MRFTRRIKHWLQSDNLPLVTLTVGVLGFALQLWLFATGIDEKGLIVENHPATYFTLALCAGFVALLYDSLRALKKAPDYAALYPASLTCCLGNFLAGIAILTAEPRWGTVSLILQWAAALSFGYIGFCRLLGRRPSLIADIFPTAFFMIFGITQYRLWSSEPQIIRHIYPLCACVCLMLTAYHHCAMDAGFGSRKRLLFFSQLSLLFSCLSLSGEESRLLYFGAVVWTFTGICTVSQGKTKSTVHLPKQVKYCIHTLEKAGFRCYAVGGCVRDAVLDLEPQDYDLCTNATPEEIAEIFRQYPQVHSGAKHGTIGIILEDAVYEITTFRTEGSYTDSRHPDWVQFVSSVEEDLSRRDFTVNAMAYSPRSGLVDPFGGRRDLASRTLRTVGDPAERFTEDPLRILRGVRFALRYRLTPDEKTEDATLTFAPLMENLARERVFAELNKILPLVTAEDILRYAPVFVQVIPELLPTIDFLQHNPHHIHDVFTHTAYVVAGVPQTPALRWAALLHDIGKPATFTRDENGQGHFYGHAEESARLAEEILRRLKASNQLREQVVFLVKNHMTTLVPDKKFLRRRLGQYTEEGLRALLALQKADCTSKPSTEDAPEFDWIGSIIDEILQEDLCLQIKDLAINGNDLLKQGYEPGPAIGKCMTYLLEQVQQEQLSNTKEALLPAAEAFLNKTNEQT